MFRSIRYYSLMVITCAALFAGAGFAANLPDLVKLSKELKPAVVNVSTTKTIRSSRPALPPPFDQFFNQFGPDRPETQRHGYSLGSGFLISADGFILTNGHVVDVADDISVKLADGRVVKAQLKGLDDKLDLALLKIDAGATLPFLKLGDSQTLEVGEWVMAIGNPFGLEQTVTAGIVSAKGRVIGAGPYDDFIQTDASINPGNSGGPLFNMKGEVIGINTAIVAGGQGIGFAIPINAAKTIVPQLMESGFVTRGWLGVSIQPLTEELAKSFNLKESKGALVSDVISGSPAEKAKLKRGDIILTFDGQPIEHANDLSRLVAATPVDKEVRIGIFRDGKETTVLAQIAQLDKDSVQARGAAAILQSFGLTLGEQPPGEDAGPGAAVVIVQIRPESPAADARLQPGDAIVEANGRTVRSSADFLTIASQVKKGESLRLLLKRGSGLFYAVLKAQ